MAALAATSAFAQSTVEIYGRAHVGYDAKWKATGGSATINGAAVTNVAANTPYDLVNRSRVADDGSRIGFRVTEDLGSGAYAKAVIETGINMDTNSANGQSGAANSGTGFFGSRDAWVGVGNAMGDVRLGRQNVFWGNGAIEDVTANRIHFGINGAYTSPSSGWISNPMARVDNTVKFVGNSALGAFAGSELWLAQPTVSEQAAQNNANTQNPEGKAQAKANGLTLKFNQGPWAAQYDYGKFAKQLNGVGSAANQTFSAAEVAAGELTAASQAAAATTKALDSTILAKKLGLAYTYAEGSKVYFINSRFEQQFRDDVVANNVLAITPAAASNTLVSYVGGNRKQSSNLLGVQHRLGAWELHAVYAKQGDATIAGEKLEESGSKAYTLGARYELSKRTALTVAATQIKNDKNNNINVSGGGQSSTAAIGYGAKLNQMGVSLMHNF